MQDSSRRTRDPSDFELEAQAQAPARALAELEAGNAVTLVRRHAGFSDAWLISALEGDRGLATLLSEGSGPLGWARPVDAWLPTSAMPTEVALHLESLEPFAAVEMPSSAGEARRVIADLIAGELGFERAPAWLRLLAPHPGGLVAHCSPIEATHALARIAGLSGEALLRRRADASEVELEQLDLFEFHRWLARRRLLIEAPVATRLPTEQGTFEVRLFEEPWTGVQQVAVIYGDISGPEPVLVRMHSECFTGDIFGSLRCDCGPQLDAALARLAEAGRGVLLYLRQEGRGIGLFHKLRAYMTQDQGLDTVEANEQLGFPADLRTYDHAATMLRKLGVGRIRLLTNNPDKIAGLARHGIEIAGREDLVVGHNPENAAYLRTKRDRMGHLFHALTPVE